MSENTNDYANPVLTFEGKKYFIKHLKVIRKVAEVGNNALLL